MKNGIDGAKRDKKRKKAILGHFCFRVSCLFPADIKISFKSFICFICYTGRSVSGEYYLSLNICSILSRRLGIGSGKIGPLSHWSMDLLNECRKIDPLTHWSIDSLKEPHPMEQ